MRKFKEKQILEITWIDSISDTGWKSKSDFLKENANSDWILHKTIGYFLCQDKNTVTVMQSYTIKDGTYNTSERMSIPIVAIRKIRVIK